MLLPWSMSIENIDQGIHFGGKLLIVHMNYLRILIDHLIKHKSTTSEEVCSPSDTISHELFYIL